MVRALRRYIDIEEARKGGLDEITIIVGMRISRRRQTKGYFRQRKTKPQTTTVQMAQVSRRPARPACDAPAVAWGEERGRVDGVVRECRICSITAGVSEGWSQ